MKKMAFVILCCWALVAGAGDNPQVEIKTSLGVIKLELDAKKAPKTVKNFLSYVDEGAYDGTIFHRVIASFMIQGGGHLPDMSAAAEKGTIRNEADNGLKNVTGSIAMARTNEIDSARRQFFINVNNNTSLDHSVKSCTREDEQKQVEASQKGLYKPVTCKTFGYAVFGKVIAGMDIVTAIEKVSTRSFQGHQNLPATPIVIDSIVRL